MMTHPKCPLDQATLKPTDTGLWFCDTCGFFYRVVRGVPGRPMWGVPEPQVEGAPQQPVSTEETFEAWLAKRGVTPEMWKDADNRMKEDLKTAFYQRGQKGADVVLLPPR